MICIEYNSYIKSLVRNLEMLWVVTLNNGMKVYSDYENPLYAESPWNRLKKYCAEYNVFPVKVESLMFGAPATVMVDCEDGLDGLFIKRGSSKDFLMESGEGTSYKQLIVGLLDDACENVAVKKFCWPHNELEKAIELRRITLENIELMLFKNDSEKKQHENIKKFS